MVRETIYLVQAFKADKGARLNADTPIRCKSSDTARRTAESLATSRVVAGYAVLQPSASFPA